MAKTNDLEKRAKEIRDKLLTKEDKTNLVARVIIELIKQEKRKIAYKRVSCEIQEMFGLKKYKPWIVYWEGAMKSRLFDIIKLCHDEKKEIPISILVDNGTKNCRNGFCDGYEKNYGKKYNLENLEKILDDAERSFNKMTFKEKVENIDAFTSIILANERIIQMRKTSIILFLRLVILIIILLICLSYIIWR